MKTTHPQIIQKIIKDTFNVPVMDNTMRGIWAEYMVAEALGETCKVVGRNWHSWDLQIGEDFDTYPNRIRIQIKNTARLQTWHEMTLKLSKSQWKMPISKKPIYFDEYHKGVPCEDYGHLCDIYILCHHPIEELASADQRDVQQWNFYLVPVVGQNAMYVPSAKQEEQKTKINKLVTPLALQKGKPNQAPVAALKFDELSEDALRHSLGI